jgi:hypothetical protein
MLCVSVDDLYFMFVTPRLSNFVQRFSCKKAEFWWLFTFVTEVFLVVNCIMCLINLHDYQTMKKPDSKHQNDLVSKIFIALIVFGPPLLNHTLVSVYLSG